MTSRDATDGARPASARERSPSVDDGRSSFGSMSPGEAPRIEVEEALRNNWVEIWYQPKIDLKRKCLAGAEALARIRHPAIGVLWPGSFLPAVSEDGIVRLAEHALLMT